MSVELTPNDHENIKELLDFMRELGKDKIQVGKLILAFRNVLYKLGYSDDDIITVEELEKIINVGNGNKYSHVPKSSQENLGTLNHDIPTFPTDGNALNSDNIGEKEDLSLLLKAIRETIDNVDRPYKTVPFYVLFKYGELSSVELRDLTVKYGKELLNLEFSHSTLKKAMSTVNTSPYVYKRDDDITKIKYYRLTEKARNEILKTYEILLKEKEIQENQEKVKSADFEELVKVAFEFLKDFYKDKVIDLFTVKAQDYLVVDWTKLESLAPKLAEVVVDNPRLAIAAFEEALKLFQVEEMFRRQEEVKHIKVHFRNVGLRVLRVKDLSARHFGKMVTVRGLISGVTSKKKQFYSKMVLKCKDCSREMVRLQDPIAKVSAPTKCEYCGSKNLEVDVEKSVTMDILFFSLQDMVEDLGNKEQPSKVMAYVLDSDVSLAPGDRVVVTGIVRDTVFKDKKQLTDLVLEVNHVEFVDELEVGEISEEDVMRFKQLAERYGDDLPNAIARSLAPHIFAHPTLLPALWFFKKAIVYAIASRKELGPGDERLWIHVLAVGDKGTGKSRIIRDIRNVTIAVYGEGGNLSGAGLIGMPEREEFTGEWIFRGGLMVRANGHVLALDEFEKAKPEDYARMHGGMSFGYVDFSKASISTTLKTMESVIAVANPPGGWFNNYKNVFDQIPLPHSLLDRFDLIFIIRQPTDPEVLEAIYEHLDKVDRGEVQREISEDVLRKFFLYVRELKPEFTEEALEEIKRFGLQVNKALMNAGFKYSMRLRGILKRLAMANAQLRLSDKVELKDVKAAEEVFTAAIRSWSDEGVDWTIFGEIEAQASKEVLELLRMVTETFEKLHKYYAKIPEDEVLEYLRNAYGLDMQKARYAISVAENRGLIRGDSGFWWLASHE